MECVVEGCGRLATVKVRGFCGLHYQRWRKHGSIEPVRRRVLCVVEGCARRCLRPKGLCMTHYSRLQRRGTVAERVRPSVEERFWAKVDKDGPVPAHAPELGNCWEWTAGAMRRGYGRFALTSRAMVCAHRYSYEREVGPIPVGLELDHLCCNPPCVRPSHLEPVTQAVNRQREAAYRRSRRMDIEPTS